MIMCPQIQTRPTHAALRCRYKKPSAGSIVGVPADAAAAVRAAAKPFVEWLEEAEDESEEEGSDEE